jgi:dTDP-4-dehydrorhamnose reductase
VKKYLILGASGLLGSKLITYLPNSNGTYFENTSNIEINMSFLDVNNPEIFRVLLEKIKPDVVINCTGMTNVDLCERFPEKCWKLNCWLPVILAEECNAKSIKYVYISTDHFLNVSKVKLKESDFGVPINQYGLSKSNAEKFIHSVNEHSMIIRSNFFHFNLESPKTFLDKLIYSIKEGKVSHSFSDVLFTPISTFQLAVYIQKLVEKDFAGFINISSSEVLSKFDFHSAVLKEMTSLTEFHLPVLLDSVELHAVRPKYMALDNNLLQKTLGVQVPSIYDMINTELKLTK